MRATRPTYWLRDVQAAVSDGRYWITQSAKDGAARLGFDERDVCDCVAMLGPSHFDKTMVANSRPGLFQDVYRVNYCGERLYVKLQFHTPTHAVVISFKQE